MAGTTSLWVGGTSALARTYFAELWAARRAEGHRMVVTGLPGEAHARVLPDGVSFVELDLTDPVSVATLWERLPVAVDALIFGVRMSLVWSGGGHVKLVTNLRAFFEGAAGAGCRSFLHISSVAVADHVSDQVMLREDDPLPPLAGYEGAYDIFKRVSEDILSEVCEGKGLPCVHLRIGGIFSNGPDCIQCGSLRLTERVGAYLPAKIDFNSSRNVGLAISAVLDGLSDGRDLHRVYYYTRSTAEPVQYGSHVADWRSARGIRAALWMPVWLAYAFLSLIRLVAWVVSRFAEVSLLVSVDYLIRVCTTEHSFDNNRFRTDFPAVAADEESVIDAFRRILAHA